MKLNKQEWNLAYLQLAWKSARDRKQSAKRMEKPIIIASPDHGIRSRETFSPSASGCHRDSIGNYYFEEGVK